MRKNIVSIFAILIFFLTSCSTQKKIEPEDEFAVEAEMETGKDLGSESAEGTKQDELSLDEATEGKSSEEKADMSLEEELNNLSADGAPPADSSKDELSLDAPPQEPPAQPPVVQQEAEPPPPVAQQEVEPPPPVIAEELTKETPPSAESSPGFQEPESEVTTMREDFTRPAAIDNLTYKTNNNGGTIVVSANAPLNFSTRMNSATNQFVVTVENSVIPSKLKRSLITKDMNSSISSVDIYQKNDSNIVRFVVQLRPDSPEPIVQPEGNSILIIGGGTTESGVATRDAQQTEAPPTEEAVAQPQTGEDMKPQPSGDIVDLATDGIMSSDDLEEFLISNNKFYGKKISIETNKMELKEAFKFLAEESGVNLIIDETVAGQISLKLRDVPWDQALILILKSKKLGFKRQGNVLRIGKIIDFKKDEAEAIALKEARKAKAPLIIKRFFIGYADIKELEKKIGEYLTQVELAEDPNAVAENGATTSEPVVDLKAGVKTAESIKGEQKESEEAAAAVAKKRKATIGKVIVDEKNNSLIVTDTEENMVKIAKLIEALDTQPQQVLIEGKVVEAKESFTRGLGVTWNSVPNVANTTNRFRVGINPILDAGSVVLDSAFTWGQLDLFGQLDARLQLGEREDKVRVLSSPRIAVLSNEKATISQTAGLLIPKSTSSGGVTTVSNDVVEYGVTLDVTPVVSNEGTVKLTMSLERSFLARVDSTTPEKRNAKTKIVVKSGQTAVIGGIFESEQRVANSGVPGLKDVPILGSLFKSEADGKSKNELVIFVTPTILKPVVGSEKVVSEIK